MQLIAVPLGNREPGGDRVSSRVFTYECNDGARVDDDRRHSRQTATIKVVASATDQLDRIHRAAGQTPA